MINNKYEIINKITHGEFGNIYKVKYKNNFFALKEDNNIYNLLKHEAMIYYKLSNIQYISKLYDFFQINNKYYILLDLFDINFVEYKNNNNTNNRYISNIYDFFYILINTIKDIHNIGYVHRDLKPQNICIYNNKPYIIDFGLSKKIFIKNSHIKKKKIKNIIGSYSYISKNVFDLIEPSRRDDIESLFYIFIYMIIDNDLEYLITNIKFSDCNIFDKLINKKYINIENIKIIYNYIQKLSFTQKPNYDYINQNLFTNK